MTSRYAVRDRQPVQREAGAPRPQGELQAAAEAGTAGPGAALPHAERIQGAFGHHDLGAVQAYTGAAATQASEAMGANAFATGSKVAFRGAPSLHTAAHEAAHVIQQRGGVSLSGGVGRAGDRYEREADQVADAVVAGHSAEPILDRSAGGSGGGSDAVQLDTGSPTPAAPRAPTPAARPRPEGAASGAAGGTAHDDGAAPDPSRAVVAQLNDPAIWEVPPDDPTASANLQSMLSLAVAQGQAGAAYSIALRLHKAESHRAVLVRAGVVDEQGHVTPSTPPQRDRASLGQAIVGGADAVGTALDLVRRAEQSPEHFSRSGIRLDTLADVADYAAATPQPGIETRSDAQREAAERRSTLPVHFAHLSREQEQAQVNTLGIEAENGDHGGRLNLIIPGLALEALDTQVAGGSLSAMTIATGVVRVVATWPTPRCADAPTTFTVNIQSLALRRVAYLAGGSTFAMRELGAGSIVVHARSVPESVRRVRGPGEAPGAVREVLVEGSVAQAIVGFLVPHLSAFAGDALGAFHAAGRQGEQLPGGLTLDVHGLYVDGLTTPGGIHAARIDVGQAHVETERLRAPVTRMRMRQLEDRLREAQVRQAELQRQGGTDPVDAHERTRLDAERTQMQAQLEQLRAQIPQLEAEDNEYLGLLGRQQGGQSPLNDAERARLQALQATRTARMAIDVDRVAVTGFGMHAGEDRGSVAITGVHAETDTSGAMVNPFPSGRSAAEPRGTTTSGGPADNQLHIGRIRATDIHLGLPNYRQQHDHKAELDAIADADLSDAQRTERDGLRALWVRRVPNDTAFGTYGDIVDRLLAIEGRGDVALARDWAAQTERDRLQHALGRYQTTIGSIDVRGVSLGTQGTQSSVDAGAISGRAFAGDAQAAVGELDVHSVRSGDGDGADRAFATGVRGDASLLVSRMTQTDLHGRTQSDSHAAVREAHVAADTIRVEGAQVGATRVGAAQIDGARIDASSTRDGGTVGLHVDRMQVFDVQVPARLERLRAELAELNSGARTPAQDRRSQEIQSEIHELEALPGLAAAAQSRVDQLTAELGRTRNPARRAVVQHQLADAQAEVDRLQARARDTRGMRSTGTAPVVDLQQTDVRVSGLGPTLGTDMNIGDRDLDVTLGLDVGHVGSFAMQSPDREIGIDAVDLNGLSVAVTVHTTSMGDGQVRIDPVRLRRLALPSLSAHGLHLRFPNAAGEVDLRMPEAAIDGVSAENLPLSAEGIVHPTEDGHFQIAHAHAALSARIGQHIRAHAQFSVAENLRIGLTHSGQVSFDPGNLSLDVGATAHGDAHAPAGSLLSRIQSAGGELHIHGVQARTQLDTTTGRMTVRGPIGVVGVSNVRVAAGGATGHLGSAAMEQIQVDAQIDLDPAVLAAQARGATSDADAPLVRSMNVRQLDIARIVGSDIHVANPAEHLDVALRRGAIEHVRVSGFNPDARALRVTAGGGRGPAAQLDGLQIVAGALQIHDGELRANSFSFQRANNGAIDAQVGGASLDAQVSGASDGNGGAGHLHVGGAGLGLHMGRDGSTSMTANIGSVGVSNLIFEAGTTAAVNLGQASLNGIQVAASMNAPPHSENAARTVTYSLDLQVGNVEIRRGVVDADGLHVDMPEGGSIRGLGIDHLHYEVQQSAPDAQGERQTLSSSLSSANVGFRGLDLTNAGVVVPGLLSGHGSLSCGALSVNALGHGAATFALGWIRLHHTDASLPHAWRITALDVAVPSAEAHGITGRVTPEQQSVTMQGASVGIASGHRGGQLDAVEEAPASGADFSIRLPLLQQLQGAFALTLWDSVPPIPIPITNGHLMFDSSQLQIPATLPYPFDRIESLIGGRPRWVQAIASLVNSVTRGLDGYLNLQTLLQDAISDAITGRTPPHDAMELQTALAQWMATSRLGPLVAEALAPQGQGLVHVGTAWLEQHLVALFDRRSAQYMADIEAQRRADAMRAWIDTWRIDGHAGADGPFNGMYRSPQGEVTNFSGGMHVMLTVTGALREHLNASFEANARDIDATHGATTVHMATAGIGAGISMGDRSQTLGGQADAQLTMGGVTIVHNGALSSADEHPPAPRSRQAAPPRARGRPSARR